MKLLCRMTVWLLLAAMLAVPASAVDADWLVPKMREAPVFTDTAGAICEDAARICCEAGLMTGVDARHFMPEIGLSNAQILVISARLHRLLMTGSVGEFDSYHLPKDQWWYPYDQYLREQIPEFRESADYAAMCQKPARICSRLTFLKMLGAVLDCAGTVLPELNRVDAVPDCCEQEILRFYRTGILGGKDAYGSLDGNGPLSRGAAAAMLARLIVPAQRLRLALKPLELCGELLNVPPETVLFSVGGVDVSAEQFMPALAETLSSYNHSHLGAMYMEGRLGELAVSQTARLVQAEILARESGVDFPECNAVYYDGYKGLSAAAQAWDALHHELLLCVQIPDGAPLPEVRFAEVWERLPINSALTVEGTLLEPASCVLEGLPYWGGAV